MSGNAYIQSLLEEAARLFGVQWAHLFTAQHHNREPWVIEAEYAIAYTLWIAQSTESLWKHVGRDVDIMSKITACLRLRKQSPKYDALVGDLVWFAQRLALSGIAA